jgi:hypothetical protein
MQLKKKNNRHLTAPKTRHTVSDLAKHEDNTIRSWADDHQQSWDFEPTSLGIWTLVEKWSC